MSNLFNTLKTETCGYEMTSTLLNEFGSLGSAFNANNIVLKEQSNIDSEMNDILKSLWSLHQYLCEEKFSAIKQYHSCKSILDYYYSKMSFLAIEQINVLYLDRNLSIILDVKHQSGTSNKVELYPKEIIKKALSLNSTNIVIIHNHPSGCSKPSMEDLGVTFNLKHLAEKLDINIHDHIIIGKNNYYSFKENGLLN